jgi:nucleoside 2-deoxyribosyltransferase
LDDNDLFGRARCLLAEAIEIGQAKKELCGRYGFEGLFPLDAELTQEQGTGLSTRIFVANMEALVRCDAVVANVTPFRGVSADVGTVFEIAYARALAKPVFAYTNIPGDLRQRVAAGFGLRETAGTGERDFARDGMAVENFGLADNLMIVEAIRLQGWDIAAHAAPSDQQLTSLIAFEDCMRRARQYFATKASSAAA